MKKYDLNTLTAEEVNALCKRPGIDLASVLDSVKPIIRNVKDRGDQALMEYTLKFDKAELSRVAVDPEECDAELADHELEAIDLAMRNVQRFHKEQLQGVLEVETMPGITCSRIVRPIDSVGLYIPGGTAPLPSTAIMLGIPAVTAGCKTIVMATPPDSSGNIPPAIAYIAQKIGAEKIVKAGGAQAIAAMAYGTESIPKVDKIFGPGNQYVTAAKMWLQNSDAMISIDLPAGPSEVLVIADKTADPNFVAIDLLSQTEHGPDSQAVLVSIEGFNVSELEKKLESLLSQLPRRETARKALEHSFILQTDTIDRAMVFSNRYAPEHLILNFADSQSYTDQIINAGSVFLGPWTPESLGDYASGTNHTLPTYGYAKMYSGVSLQSFQKTITLQNASADGLRQLGPIVETLADMEGLDAHKLAVSLRLKKLEQANSQ